MHNYQKMSGQTGESLQGVIRDQAKELEQLKMELSRQQDQVEIFKEIGRFPAQFRAGVVDWPGRKPFTYLYRQELVTGSGNQTFGATTQIARASFNTDNDNPTHLPRIKFSLIRTAHDTPSPTIPLNTYLPLGGVSDAGLKGLDFEWQISSSSDSRKWQSGWRDSSDLDFVNGYEFVCEHPLYRDDVIIVEARPFQPADALENEAYRLFCSLHSYKMYEKYPHA